MGNIIQEEYETISFKDVATARKKVWIAFLGMSPVAIINCIWCAIKRDSFIPDKVILIATEKAEQIFEQYKELLYTLLLFYNPKIDKENFLEIVKISNTPTFTEMNDIVTELIQKYKQQSASIAVDITPGRKIMSVVAISAALHLQVDRIYYLLLTDEPIYRDKLYGEIPCIHNKLYVILGSELSSGKLISELSCTRDAFPKH